MKGHAEVTISKYLYDDIQKQGNLEDFEDHIKKDLKRHLLMKVPQGVSLPENWEDYIGFYKDKEDDGNMTYRVLLYIPENSGMQLVR